VLRHARQIGEDSRDLLVDAALGGLEPAAHLLEVGLVAAVEIGGDQIVLAPEMVVERAFGEPCLFSHRIDADAADAFGIEQFRRRIDEAFAGGAGGFAHAVKYTD